MVKKILISQPKPASDKSPYYDIAEDFDVELVFRPFIKVEGISTREFRDQRVNIADYTAIVFTSRHAIDNFFKLAGDKSLEKLDEFIGWLEAFSARENVEFVLSVSAEAETAGERTKKCLI